MEKKRKKTVDENTPISPSYISIYQNVSASIPFNHEIFDNTKTNLSKINEIIREDVPQDESQDLFEKHYMDIFTREFEDELDELRKDPSFDPQTMPILVAALKKGVNIFSPEEKQKVLNELERKEKQKSNNNSSKKM